MMKKNRPTMLSALLIIAMALFTFSAAYAQEEVKEEKKMITIKMTTDDDGNVTIDTTITLDGDFDGDWKKIITDEEMLKKLEEIEIDIDIESDGNVYIMKTSPHTSKAAYFYTVETDGEGEVVVDIDVEEMADGEENVWVTTEGDSVMMFVTTSVAKQGSHPQVMAKTIEIVMDDDGNVIKKVISDDNDFYFDGGDVEIIELKDHHGAMIFISKIMVSDISEEDLAMLADASVKVGKETLHLHELKINTAHNGNLKVEFHANELKNLSVSLLTAWGKQIYLEELKTLDGKYIREIEIPGEQDGDFYLHIRSGKKSLIKKINLD